MDASLRINEGDIYRWFSIFRPTGKLVEIRVKDKRGKLWSGYFKTPEGVIGALKDNPELLKGNVFQVFNTIDESCYSRDQKERFLVGATTTGDEEIKGRSWVFIDIDPIRPSDTNASNEDEKYAINVARKIVKYLLGEGFHEPVVVASANGAHIYIRCQLQNTPENKKLVEKFIRVMGMLFNDEKVKIDPVIFNASRLAKLPGTMSGKGNADDTEYPQRWCRFLKVPDDIQVTERAFFEKVANLLPEPPKPSYENNWGREKFDLRSFIQKHGIAVRQEVRTSEGTRFILEHCVFNENHKAKDAMIFQYDNGSIAYKCFHASCSDRTWRDVRMLFEPDAYSRSEYADFTYRQKMRGEKPAFVPQAETPEKGPKWLSLGEIKTLDPDSLVSIGTDISALDGRIYGGTILQQLSVLTGRPASGKSTLLNTILLGSIKQGFPTAIFSGELPNHMLKSWITLPAAGRGYVKSIKKKDYYVYYVPKEIEDMIVTWLKDKLFVYNTEYGNNWNQLKEDIKEVIGKGAKNIILDNLMTIDINNEDDRTKTKAQIDFVKDLHDMVRTENVHIWLVAHPRKQTNFLRYDDIAGASEIGNLADNIFLIHRVNQDFENQAKAFFPKDMVNDILDKKYTNVIEIAKNRVPGNHIGELVGVYYDSESKQMKDSEGQIRTYGWVELLGDNAPTPSVSIVANTDFDNQPEMWYNKDNDNGQDDNLPF